MNMRDDAESERANPSSGTNSEGRIGWFFVALAVIGLLVLGFEHRPHLLDWLPVVLRVPVR